MKTRLLLLMSVLVSQIGFSQIFNEDFENTGGAMPAGWTVINNDGLTPDPNVAQFTDAWIVAGDFDNTADSVVMSTSWYSPAGTSDDWLISPAIAITGSNVLTWEEEGQDANFPDGYEVRISTTTPTIAGFTANPALLTVASSSPGAWITQTVDLAAAGYANQSVYLAWRNNSTDQFILMIDDIDVSEVLPFDVAMSDTAAKEYTLVPLPHVQTLGVNGLITNLGGSSVTNANMTVNVYDGTMTNVYAGTSNTIPTIAPGASSAVTATGYTPTLPDVYTVELISNITELDSDLTNDTTFYTYVVTDSVYARDDGVITGALGIGTGTGGQLGQSFDVVVADDITSVSMFIVNGTYSMYGRPLSATIFDTDATGTPVTALVSTSIVNVDSTQNNLWTIPITGGSYTLNPGKYVVVVNEIDSNVSIATTNSVFTTGETWVLFGANPWANNEAYGFNVSYVLRPNFAVPICVETGSTVTDIACNTFTWAQNGNTYTTSGMYNDTVMNAAGCDSIITLDLTIGSVDITTSTLANTITANEASATYQWIDCTNGNAVIAGETGQSFMPTSNGDYAVILAVGSCVDTSDCITISTIGINETAFSQGIDIYPNPSNGAFTITVNDLPIDELKVEILDARGRILMTTSNGLNNGNGNIPVSLNDVEAGIYFVNLISGDKRIVERIVINKK